MPKEPKLITSVLSSKQVIADPKLKAQLTNYELSEIKSFDKIYFIGERSVKRQEQFDNQDGYYIAIVHDQVKYRYEILELLGVGSFGHVVKCFDHKFNNYVALKITKNRK